MAVPPDALQRAFGEALRARRIAQGLSQERVALEAGLSLRHVSELERGRQNPSLATIVAIARALGCRAGELVDGAVTGAL